MNNTEDKVIYMSSNDKFRGYKFNETTYTEPSSERSDNSMSGGSSIDTLFSEIKKDMREREERSRREISDREERFVKQMELFKDEAAEREKRLSSEFKEREERIIKTLGDLETKLGTQTAHVESMKTQNFWGSIALFVGMLAIVITLIIAVLA